MLFLLYWTFFAKTQGIVGIISYCYQKAQMELFSQVRAVINAKRLDKLISEHREREVISVNPKNKIPNSEREVISDKAKSKIPNSEPENVESTPISNSKFLKVIPNNYEYTLPFFSPNYKFETDLVINLAEILPVEANSYEPESEPSNPAELEEPLNRPEPEPLNIPGSEPHEVEKEVDSTPSPVAEVLYRLFGGARRQSEDDNEENNLDAQAIEGETLNDAASDSVLRDLSSSRFDSESEYEDTNKVRELNFISEQKALINSLPELSDLSEKLKSLRSEDLYLENKYSIKLIKGIEIENLNDAQAIEENLDVDENVDSNLDVYENVDSDLDVSENVDSSLDSEESVRSSKKRSQKALSAPKPKKPRVEGLN